jgi:hypothetical protein
VRAGEVRDAARGASNRQRGGRGGSCNGDDPAGKADASDGAAALVVKGSPIGAGQVTVDRRCSSWPLRLLA